VVGRVECRMSKAKILNGEDDDDEDDDDDGDDEDEMAVVGD
jgi:hypothetical protein